MHLRPAHLQPAQRTSAPLTEIGQGGESPRANLSAYPTKPATAGAVRDRRCRWSAAI